MKRTEHTQKWLDALRSGKYKQGFGGLSQNGAFCCLGVACDVYAPHEWEHRDGYSAHPFGAGTMNYDGRETFGMDADEAGALIEMNDSEKKSFPEIADEIEEMLEPEACQ